MSEPNVVVGGLSIWVIGREFPTSSDFWDGNWLKVRATMRSGHSSVTAEGPILTTMDFERFRNELAAVYATVSGEASLAGYEPNLKVRIGAGPVGQIDGKVEITPDHLSEFHRFEISGWDQTYLPALIASCDALLGQYPVVNRPEG